MSELRWSPRSSEETCCASAWQDSPAFGNTEVLGGMIAGRLGCDVHRIRAAEPYSAD